MYWSVFNYPVSQPDKQTIVDDGNLVKADGQDGEMFKIEKKLMKLSFDQWKEN